MTIAEILAQHEPSEECLQMESMTDTEWQQHLVDLENDVVGDLDQTDGYNCPICKNKGIIIALSAEGEHKIRFCKCTNIRNFIRRAQASGLTDTKINKIEDFRTDFDWQKMIKDNAERFVENPEKCFFIGGQSGAGKTMICTGICRGLLVHGKDVLYFLWRKESTKLKSMVSDPVMYQREIEKWKIAPVLYIDDFYKVQAGQKPTPADVNIAFEILNERFLDAKKVTLISSEFFSGEITDIDEAVGGRIIQAAGSYIVDISRDKERNQRLKLREKI